jgi:hypothetical protein
MSRKPSRATLSRFAIEAFNWMVWVAMGLAILWAVGIFGYFTKHGITR